MSWPEDHTTRELHRSGTDLTDQIRSLAKPIYRHSCGRFKIWKSFDEFAAIEYGPLMEVRNFQIPPHPIEGGDIFSKTGHETIPHAGL